MGNYPVRNTVFKGTAQYYATYRPAIPAQVISHLGTCFDLDGSGMLLDMGCGTGQSTFALAPLFKKSFAFDVDPQMLAEAKKRCPAHLDIVWQQRSDQEVTRSEGPYKLVTACRSFNWMDQNSLLDKLNEIIEPNGGVALIGDGSFWTGREVWQKKIKEVIQRFLGEKRRAGSGTYVSSEEPYVTSLKKHHYHDVDAKTIPVERQWTVESILGYLYSTSFAARHLFGEKIENFEQTLKNELLHTSAGSDNFIERTEFTVQTGFVRFDPSKNHNNHGR